MIESQHDIDRDKFGAWVNGVACGLWIGAFVTFVVAMSNSDDTSSRMLTVMAVMQGAVGAFMFFVWLTQYKWR